MWKLVHGSRAGPLLSVCHMNHILLCETGRWSQAADRCSREPAILVGLQGMPWCVPQWTSSGRRCSVQVFPAGSSHLSPFPGITLQGGSSLTQGCKCSQGAAIWLLDVGCKHLAPCLHFGHPGFWAPWGTCKGPVATALHSFSPLPNAA